MHGEVVRARLFHREREREANRCHFIALLFVVGAAEAAVVANVVAAVAIVAVAAVANLAVVADVVALVAVVPGGLCLLLCLQSPFRRKALTWQGRSCS